MIIDTVGLAFCAVAVANAVFDQWAIRRTPVDALTRDFLANGTLLDLFLVSMTAGMAFTFDGPVDYLLPALSVVLLAVALWRPKSDVSVNPDASAPNPRPARPGISA